MSTPISHNSTTYPFNFRPDNLAPDARLAGAVRLTDVKPENICWLWPGRIPIGRVTLLVSDPGLGKSLLTLDIAARVSRGAHWPDQPGSRIPCGPADSVERQGDKLAGRQGDTPANPSLSVSPCLPVSPSSVLLLTAEDDLADTVRPRLEALGADCDKILAISSVPGENANDVPRSFALNRDLAWLKNLLKAIPDCCLLIIDPVSAYLGGANEHANSDVQSLLTSLARLARDRDIAVIIVSHLRKKEGSAIYRTMGSLAFVAAARAAWVVCKNPADPNNRFFLPLKNNLAPDVTGLAFTVEASGETRTPVIRWSPDAVNITPETVLQSPIRPRGRPDEERQFAMKWLLEQLADAPLPTRDVKEDAEAFGITYSTLRRAFRSLDGEAIRCGWPFKSWHWKLPSTNVQKYDEEFFASNYIDKLLAESAAPWMPKRTPGATNQQEQQQPLSPDLPCSSENLSASAAGPPEPACHPPP